MKRIESQELEDSILEIQEYFTTQVSETEYKDTYPGYCQDSVLESIEALRDIAKRLHIPTSQIKNQISKQHGILVLGSICRYYIYNSSNEHLKYDRNSCWNLEDYLDWYETDIPTQKRMVLMLKSLAENHPVK